MGFLRYLLAVAAVLLSGAAAQAQGWTEPARGTETRAALMDALRPHAEWALGPQVEFIVYELRQSGDLAFGSVGPQRPGGRQIDLRLTPAFTRGQIDPQMMDGVAMQALYQRSGRTWVAVHWAMGATDVWYADPELCAIWHRVIPEACQGI